MELLFLPVGEFLAVHSMPQGPSVEAENSSPAKKRQKKVILDIVINLYGCLDSECVHASLQESIVDSSEDSQLQAAIQASLRESSSAICEISSDDDISSVSEEEAPLETFSGSEDEESSQQSVVSQPKAIEKPSVNHKTVAAEHNGVVCSSDGHSNDVGDDKETESAGHWEQYLGSQSGELFYCGRTCVGRFFCYLKIM